MFLIQKDLIKSIKEGKPEKKATNELPYQYKEALSSISNLLNTKVEIKRANNGKGKIILNFTSDDEFERLRKFLNEN